MLCRLPVPQNHTALHGCIRFAGMDNLAWAFGLHTGSGKNAASCIFSLWATDRFIHTVHRLIHSRTVRQPLIFDIFLNLSTFSTGFPQASSTVFSPADTPFSRLFSLGFAADLSFFFHNQWNFIHGFV